MSNPKASDPFPQNSFCVLCSCIKEKHLSFFSLSYIEISILGWYPESHLIFFCRSRRNTLIVIAIFTVFFIWTISRFMPHHRQGQLPEAPGKHTYQILIMQLIISFKDNGI